MSLIDDIRSRVNDEFKRSLKAQVVTDKKEQFGNVSFGVSAIPRIIEKGKTDWVIYGEDNLWPQQIDELSKKSAIHGGIISTVADLIAGDGFLINGAKTKEESDSILKSQPAEVQAKYKAFLDNKYDSMSAIEVKEAVSLDLKKHGGYYIELIWNTDFTSISRIKHIPYKNMRVGKMSEGKIKSFWYCRDWANSKKDEFKPKELFAFDEKDKKNYNQILYRKRGSDEYYGEPDYIQGIDWINIDYQLGLFHLSNIENGMNPSLLWKFYKLPKSENDKQEILDDIRRNYKGANKAGKHITLFSDGKELAADVAPVQVNNLDKQLLNLAELSDKKILTAHKLTSPLLAGISISGQLGGNVEIEKAFNIFDKSRVLPYRNMVDRDFQMIMEINKIPLSIKTNAFNPFV